MESATLALVPLARKRTAREFSMQNYWCAARLMSRREAYATHCLGVEGFETYLPRLREQRVIRGRRVEVRPPLFPGYIFIAIVLQWHAARWAPGVAHIIMDGMTPAKVPDRVIAEIAHASVAGWSSCPSRGGSGPGTNQDHAGTVPGPPGALRRPGAPRPARGFLRFLGAQQRTELPASAIEVAS